MSLYEKRNMEIIQYFEDRPQKLLILNICENDSTKSLYSFLGIKPDTQETLPKHYPHLLRTKR